MLTQAVLGLLENYRKYTAIKKPPVEAARIHVDEVAAKFAKAYEQVRNVVDYREEHLLRQRSILRSLQRGILFHGNKDEIAERLIKEMIRSGHFSNDRIPATEVARVQRLINNLLFLLEAVRRSAFAGKSGLSMWLMNVTASAVEESIDPPWKDRASASAMFDTLYEHIIVTGGEISERDKEIQLFIAIQKSLLRVDPDQLSCRLLKRLYPNWEDFTPEELAGFAEHLPAIKYMIDMHVKNPLKTHFFNLCNQYNTVFLLLGDAVFGAGLSSERLSSVVADEEAFSSAIRDVYKKRYDQQRQRLKRLAFFSVISLFVSKIIIALAIEIPIDTYVTNSYSLMNTIISLLFPPFLMVIIIGFIRMPSVKNLDLVIAEVRAAVYRKYEKKYLLAIPQGRRSFIQTFVRVFFFAIAILVLWGMWTILERWHFSVASAAVFVLFTSIVCATGIRVQNRAKDISLEPSNHSIRLFAWDLIVMPFITIGQLTIAGLSKFKILVLLFDLIDAPFQVFILFIENFNIFLRSKKDEMY